MPSGWHFEGIDATQVKFKWPKYGTFLHLMQYIIFNLYLIIVNLFDLSNNIVSSRTISSGTPLPSAQSSTSLYWMFSKFVLSERLFHVKYQGSKSQQLAKLVFPLLSVLARQNTHCIFVIVSNLRDSSHKLNSAIIYSSMTYPFKMFKSY